MAKTHVTMKVNGAEVEGPSSNPRTLLVHFLREKPFAHRHPYRLRNHPLRRLHRRFSTAMSVKKLHPVSRCRLRAPRS